MMAGDLLQFKCLKGGLNAVLSDAIRGGFLVELSSMYCVSPAGKLSGIPSLLSWRFRTKLAAHHEDSAACIRANHIRGQLEI